MGVASATSTSSLCTVLRRLCRTSSLSKPWCLALRRTFVPFRALSFSSWVMNPPSVEFVPVFSVEVVLGRYERACGEAAAAGVDLVSKVPIIQGFAKQFTALKDAKRCLMIL